MRTFADSVALLKRCVAFNQLAVSCDASLEPKLEIAMRSFSLLAVLGFGLLFCVALTHETLLEASAQMTLLWRRTLRSTRRLTDLKTFRFGQRMEATIRS